MPCLFTFFWAKCLIKHCGCCHLQPGSPERAAAEKIKRRSQGIASDGDEVGFTLKHAQPSSGWSWNGSLCSRTDTTGPAVTPWIHTHQAAENPKFLSIFLSSQPQINLIESTTTLIKLYIKLYFTDVHDVGNILHRASQIFHATTQRTASRAGRDLAHHVVP